MNILYISHIMFSKCIAFVLVIIIVINIFKGNENSNKVTDNIPTNEIGNAY